MVAAIHAAGSDPDLALFRRALPCQFQTGLSVHPQRIQIAGIDLDDARPALPGQHQILFAADFHHGLHAEAFRLFPQTTQQRGIRGKGHDEQQGRCRSGCRGPHLQRIKDKILAQQGRPGATGSRPPQEIQLTGKKTPLREDGQGPCPGRHILPGSFFHRQAMTDGPTGR